MPCRGKCSFNWLVGYPKPQDIRGHLHTCWLVLLHQKPAGSMKAELTVGIRAFVKIGHHSCSHGWFCWGEKRHLAQICRKTCLPVPPGQEGQSPDGSSYCNPSIAHTQFLPETPALGALQQGFVIYLCRKQNSLSKRFCMSQR